MNRPSSASRKAGIFLRSAPLARSASTSGSWVPADHRVEHQPRGLAEHLRGDRGQLDPRVLQRLLDALHLASAFLDLRFAVADQVTQFPQRPGRHEARSDEAVLDQLAAPLGVLNIALATGDVTQMTSVEQLALELVLEQVVDRPPVHAGGLHPDDRHRPAPQPVRERDQPRGRRAKLADLLPAAAVAVRNAHAGGDLRLVNIEHRATLDQTIHDTPPEHRTTGRPPGRASCRGV